MDFFFFASLIGGFLCAGIYLLFYFLSLVKKEQASVKRLKKVSNPNHTGLSQELKQKSLFQIGAKFLEEPVITAWQEPETLLDHLRQKITRAGLKTPLKRVFLYIFFMWMGLSFLFPILFPISLKVSLIFSFVLSLLISYYTLQILRKKYKENFLRNFVSALDIIVRGLKAGLPMHRTLITAAKEVDAPVGPEFQYVCRKLDLGAQLDEILFEIGERVDIEDFYFLAATISIQKETGGSLSENLATLADVIRRRQEIRLKAQALAAESKTTAIIVGGIPFLVYGILNLITPGYFDVLFETPEGNKLLLVFIGLLFGGFITIRSITNLDI